MSTEYNWKKILEAGNRGHEFLDENEIREVHAEGDKICMTKREGELYAFDTKCPHNGFGLVKGIQKPGCILECPLHRYAFDLRSGKNTSGEGFYLPVYPVKIEDDGVYIGMEKRRKFLGLF